MNPIKILAIENDEFIKIFLKDAFWIHGHKNNFQITIIDSLEKAEKIINNPETKPHLIFLDLFLPPAGGMRTNIRQATGNEAAILFLKKLKSDSKTKNIKVIVFSAYGEKELEDQALGTDADKFLVKGEMLPEEIVKIAEELVGNLSSSQDDKLP